CDVAVHLLQGFTGQITAIEQRQGQIFGKTRIGGHRNQHVGSLLMDKLFQRSLYRKLLPWCRTRREVHGIASCAAMASAPKTGRTLIRLITAFGCSCLTADRNDFCKITDPWKTPPAIATRMTRSVGQRRRIAAHAKPANCCPAS